MRILPSTFLAASLFYVNSGIGASSDFRSHPLQFQDQNPPVAASKVVWSIGSTEHPTFHMISAVVFADSQLVVAQNSDLKIHVFGRDGSLRKTFGGKGNGPGQYQNISRLSWSGDTLRVLDGRLKRLTLLRIDGHVLTTTSVADPRDSTFRSWAPAAVLRNGANIHSATYLLREAVDGNRTVIPTVFTLFRGAKHVMLFQNDVSRSFFRVGGQPPERHSLGVVPFVAESFLRVSPSDTIFFAIEQPTRTNHSNLCRIGVFDIAGKVLHTHSPSCRVDAIPEHVRDSIISSLAARYTAGSVRYFRSLSEARRKLIQILPLPTHYPAFSQAVVSTDNRLWLKTGGRGQKGIKWIILDHKGRVVTQAVLPENVAIRAAAGEFAAGVRRGEFDIEELVLLRLTRQ